MAKRAKVIVSDVEPQVIWSVPEQGQESVPLGFAGVDVGFLWFKLAGDNSQFYQATAVDPVTLDITWTPVKVVGEVGNVNFTGIVSADGQEGITGSKTIGGFRITFRKGLLIGFDPV